MVNASSLIEQISVLDLVPYAKNSRTHSDSQVTQIAGSIQEFGFLTPVLIDGSGEIIAGHGRVLAAKKIGITHVPCIRVAHLTEAQKRAYIIADNKLALNAGWDEKLLSVEIQDLGAIGFDLSLTGFTSSEFSAFLNMESSNGLTDPDAIQELQNQPITKNGDIWLMGRHRIICGSSTDSMAVAKLLNGVRPHLMVTDPPYGVEYDPSRVSKNPLKSGKVLNDDQFDWREAWALFPGDVAYVWHASRFTHKVLESLESCDFEHRSMIIWAKDRFTLGRSHYHWQHEPAWYVVKKKSTGHWNGGRKQTTIWNIKSREDDGHGHSTQKPVECMKRPIENNSSPGQVIYDPFSGSGTTIIASEITDRACFAVELNPAYVDCAVRRWQEFTGGGAILDGDGRTFNEVASSEAR